MALNPRIQKIELGIMDMKEFTIYPLSLASEFKVSDIIAKAADAIADLPEGPGSEVTVVQVALEHIKENLGGILEMITKEDNRPVLDEIDNVQFSELAELIFDMNFTGAVKNFQGLIVKIKGLFPSTGPSPSLSETPVTE